MRQPTKVMSGTPRASLLGSGSRGPVSLDEGQFLLLSLCPCRLASLFLGPELALQWLAERLTGICRACSLVRQIIGHLVSGGEPFGELLYGTQSVPHLRGPPTYVSH